MWVYQFVGFKKLQPLQEAIELLRPFKEKKTIKEIYISVSAWRFDRHKNGFLFVLGLMHITAKYVCGFDQKTKHKIQNVFDLHIIACTTATNIGYWEVKYLQPFLHTITY